VLARPASTGGGGSGDDARRGDGRAAEGRQARERERHRAPASAGGAGGAGVGAENVGGVRVRAPEHRVAGVSEAQRTVERRGGARLRVEPRRRAGVRVVEPRQRRRARAPRQAPPPGIGPRHHVAQSRRPRAATAGVGVEEMDDGGHGEELSVAEEAECASGEEEQLEVGKGVGPSHRLGQAELGGGIVCRQCTQLSFDGDGGVGRREASGRDSLWILWGCGCAAVASGRAGLRHEKKKTHFAPFMLALISDFLSDLDNALIVGNIIIFVVEVLTSLPWKNQTWSSYPALGLK
jgi:hypothetical protein